MKDRWNKLETMSLRIGKADMRLVMLGHPAVGKSALVVRYLTKRFIWEYDPTLECTYRHQTQVDDEAVVLDILDTAGQVHDENSSEGHVRWGDGFLIVYSITDRSSFLFAQNIKNQLDEVRKSRNVSCILIGNKTDLEHERQVSTAEGERLAMENACAFFETSACNGGSDIEEAFNELHREVRRRKTLEGKTRRRSSAQQVKQVFNKVLTKIQNG